MLGVGLFFFSSLALAKAKTINLSHDVLLPDGQTLSAGVYTVEVDEKLDQVKFIQADEVVVTHRCKCIVHENKNNADAIITNQVNPEKKVLEGIRFRGETRTITLPS
jgi:hypothetical protein